MEVTYYVQAFQVDRADWLGKLRRAVAAELRDVGAHRSVAVSVVEDRPAGDTPIVAVAFIGPAAKHDRGLTEQIRASLSEGTVVIPVVNDLRDFLDQVPEGVSQFNGFEWSGDDPERRLARLLLEELGIEERDRRVFVSHRRSDGLGAAEQLHDSLSHHGFAPFIDRFAIPVGRNVQAQIADALEDFAFLLLLETPEAHLSDWVFDEVDYALSHTMGLLIVQWPGDPEPVPGSLGVPRVRLAPADLMRDEHGYGVLTEGALDRVLREVEAAHARGIVRRRRMLLLSVQEAARSAGANCTPLKDWALDVSGPAWRSVVGVSPRLPDSSDLHQLDKTRAAVDARASAVLVHAARDLAESRKRHLEWVVGGRDLTMVPENTIGGFW